MFNFLGKAVSRSWPIWLVGWLGLFAYLHYAAPPWNEVAQDREFGFLPADAPTRRGQELLKQAFPDDLRTSDIVIVVTRPNSALQDADRAFIRDVLTADLRKLAEDEGGFARRDGGEHLPVIADIKTLHNKGIGSLLVSDDGQATLVVIDLTSELLERRNWPIVENVEKLITNWREGKDTPAGLEFNLIGSAVVGRDMIRGQMQSAQATEFWTVIAVVIILLLIYRAPLLALIPLLSVFVATQVARMLLAILASAGLVTLFDGVEIYITVILYGAGVDYCMFLIARYQEELEHGALPRTALAQALGQVGPALAASAATVMFGIGMMVFAQFGKFHYAGLVVAFSLFVSLCVVLTFTASILRLFGALAFWPRKVTAPPADEPPRPTRWFSWETVGNAIVRQPALIWLVSVLVMAPLAVVGVLYRDNVDYDFIRRLPPDAPSVAGAKAVEAHFPAGIAGPVTVLIYEPNADFLTPDSKAQVELAVVTHRLHQQQAQLHMADIRSLTRPLGFGRAGRAAMALPLNELAQGKQQALHYYVSDTGKLKGQVTRIELTMLQEPMSRQGIASLDQLEEAIHDEFYGDLRNSEVYLLGVSADMRDLRRVTGGDQTRIQILVVVCVFVILIVLLRRLIVPLYLIASVLFSYFATLGATLAFFWWLDPSAFVGLDWKTPMFLFTILVAIGEDYNIFLMTRVAEEQEKHGRVEGIRVALVRTGRIITGCGIIMAATFASLGTGSMQDLQHLGFALAFGVLVDTFVVRPILVPTFLILLERGQLIYSKLSEATDRAEHAKEKVSH